MYMNMYAYYVCDDNHNSRSPLFSLEVVKSRSTRPSVRQSWFPARHSNRLMPTPDSSKPSEEEPHSSL